MATQRGLKSDVYMRDTILSHGDIHGKASFEEDKLMRGDGKQSQCDRLWSNIWKCLTDGCSEERQSESLPQTKKIEK